MSHDGQLSVLLVSANYRPSVGGIERFTETLAEGLAARGHRVEVICCRHGWAPLQEGLNNVTIRRVPSSTLLQRRLGVPWPIPAPVSLRRAMREAVARADIVHAQDAIYATTGAALRAATRQGVPSVLTQHVGFVPQKHRLFDVAQHAAIATLGRVSRRATAITTVSDAVADWAADTWDLERPRTFPVGVEPPIGRPTTTVARSGASSEPEMTMSLRCSPAATCPRSGSISSSARQIRLLPSRRRHRPHAILRRSKAYRLVPFVDPSRFGRSSPLATSSFFHRMQKGFRSRSRRPSPQESLRDHGAGRLRALSRAGRCRARRRPTPSSLPRDAPTNSPATRRAERCSGRVDGRHRRAPLRHHGVRRRVRGPLLELVRNRQAG